MDLRSEDVVERKHTVQMVPETVMTHAESEGTVTQGSHDITHTHMLSFLEETIKSTVIMCKLWTDTSLWFLFPSFCIVSCHYNTPTFKFFLQCSSPLKMTNISSH